MLCCHGVKWLSRNNEVRLLKGGVYRKAFSARSGHSPYHDNDSLWESATIRNIEAVFRWFLIYYSSPPTMVFMTRWYGHHQKFHLLFALARASKSCRRADARLRKSFKNLRKILNFERKRGKKRHFFYDFCTFWQSFFCFFFKFTCFYGILSPCLCAKSSVRKLCLHKRIYC